MHHDLSDFEQVFDKAAQPEFVEAGRLRGQRLQHGTSREQVRASASLR